MRRVGKRVLVTGASGFIGHHVLQPLVEMGFEVHGVARLRSPSLSGVTFHAADLFRPEIQASLVRQLRPTHLLHLAWTMTPGKVWTSLDNLSWAAATLELYRTFVEEGGRRAVLVGSAAEYDWERETLHEYATPALPVTLYGRAKNAVREIVEATAAQLKCSTAWARVFSTYGPYEPPGRLVSDLATALLAGRVAELTLGDQERDFLCVQDVGEALAVLVDGEVTGTVNIASGQAVPVRRLAQTLGRLAGRPDLLAFGARPMPPIEPKRIVADVTRLTREVGFSPRYTLDDGLQITFEWWRGRSAQ